MSLSLRPPKLSTDRVRPDEFKAVNGFFADLAVLLQGNLLLGNHVKLVSQQVNFGSADTELAVEHVLGRTPTGYIVAKNSNGTTIYDSDKAPTETRIYLKSTVANARVLLLFF